MTDAKQFATFLLDGVCFGVEVLRVQEVIRYQDITRVPLAPPTVRGLINLRGQIVTAIDLRRRLGMPDAPASARPMNVVVRTRDGAVSLLVDEIGDVVEAWDDHREPVPDTVDREIAALVTGVFKLEQRLLLILDLARAVDVPARALGEPPCERQFSS